MPDEWPYTRRSDGTHSGRRGPGAESPEDREVQRSRDPQIGEEIERYRSQQVQRSTNAEEEIHRLEKVQKDTDPRRGREVKRGPEVQSSRGREVEKCSEMT